MNALIVVAHGSRRQQSNDEVSAITDKLRVSCHHDYPIVHTGFLELAKPSIPEGIEQCINDGATRITVLPYFLNSGRHVVEDVPEIVDTASHQHPNVEIVIAPHLGASSLMIDLLIESARTVSNSSVA